MNTNGIQTNYGVTYAGYLIAKHLTIVKHMPVWHRSTGWEKKSRPLRLKALSSA